MQHIVPGLLLCQEWKQRTYMYNCLFMYVHKYLFLHLSTLYELNYQQFHSQSNLHVFVHIHLHALDDSHYQFLPSLFVLLK